MWTLFSRRCIAGYDEKHPQKDKEVQLKENCSSSSSSSQRPIQSFYLNSNIMALGKLRKLLCRLISVCGLMLMAPNIWPACELSTWQYIILITISIEKHELVNSTLNITWLLLTWYEITTRFRMLNYAYNILNETLLQEHASCKQPYPQTCLIEVGAINFPCSGTTGAFSPAIVKQWRRVKDFKLLSNGVNI